MENKSIKKSEKWVAQICKWFSVIGSIALIAMMFMVTLDVGGRFFFDKPLIGAYELVEFEMIIVIFLALAFGQINKQHVTVELFTDMVKGKKAHAILNSFTYLLSFVMFVLISYASVKQTIYIFKAKQSSLVLLLPQWPVVAVMAIGTILFTIVLFTDFLDNLTKIRKG